MFETNESDFIDTSPQSPNFPTNSLIYSKSDMLSRNSDSELTANVGSDRQRNFRSAYEALQRAGLINPDWLLYLMLAYASRVFIREKRENQPVYIRPPSIITRARARGLRGFAGSNGVKNSRPLKQKADERYYLPSERSKCRRANHGAATLRGARHEGASVKPQPQDPEAVPDFHIERERQSAGSSQAAALLDLGS
ncbi:hypothetical protein G5I_04479 [Acromyrmex echinatior]|uniref:Uncharacterized protein n=1 Tax=Acromyrmex echinatior TaxID=103372 RepID=F4WFS0_ACREC|nr:hypothetical protein G5I_04479 [Acromyrmex echinatior]